VLQETIRDKEIEFRQILDLTPLIVAVVGPDRDVLYVNQSALDYYCVPSEDCPKIDFDTFFHRDDWERVESEYQAKFLARSTYETEARLRGSDGKYRWFRFHVNPLQDEQGRITRWYVAAADIEDRKRGEEALRQRQADLIHANRITTMGELTASLAHEVYQPITAAITNANTCLRWLARDQPDLEEAREAASRIVKDATRAAEIISEIRLLFKKNAAERELVDLNELIREMACLLRGEAKRYGISIRTELAEDLPQVIGDRVQLQQVLMNLMINGIDAMKDVEGARELIIESQRGENAHVLVSVADTGVGLPSEHADQIFDAFFTTKAHGTGMGLRISRSIVESHGGRLWAADNAPAGASFYFTLPR
jgi:PAS domain S-box-containing protein